MLCWRRLSLICRWLERVNQRRINFSRCALRKDVPANWCCHYRMLMLALYCSGQRNRSANCCRSFANRSDDAVVGAGAVAATALSKSHQSACELWPHLARSHRCLRNYLFLLLLFSAGNSAGRLLFICLSGAQTLPFLSSPLLSPIDSSSLVGPISQLINLS